MTTALELNVGLCRPTLIAGFSLPRTFSILHKLPFGNATPWRSQTLAPLGGWLAWIVWCAAE
jgi:hypothetical protein